MRFFEGGTAKLAASVLTKAAPAYVQFYITARCNLACEQCNIIYANADQEEASLEDCCRIAENLAKIGTSVVLLTGGEPFVRRDLPEICKAFIANDIHARVQTNGLATRRQLEAVARAGVKDISVSLDSLEPTTQDLINGGFDQSWERAIRTVALINDVFPQDGFAAFGCVLAPRNLFDIEGVVRFATAVGWWVSLVPAHVTRPGHPANFRTFDAALRFPGERLPEVRAVLERIKTLRNAGNNVYDSDEYLDDIYRFIAGEPIRWRRRNDEVCDSPYLYFAIQPNGDMAVCCDFRLPRSLRVQSPDFPRAYFGRQLREEAGAVTRACSGCMYGSFPEISISARFFVPMLRRARLFLGGGGQRRLQRYSAERMLEIAREFRRTRDADAMA